MFQVWSLWALGWKSYGQVKIFKKNLSLTLGKEKASLFKVWSPYYKVYSGNEWLWVFSKFTVK